MSEACLFISYSHKDQEFLDRVWGHLASLQNDGLVSLWADRELRAGGSQGWEEQLLIKLNQARVIVVLLSSSFAASKYCQTVELPRALERKKSGECLVFLVHLRTYSIEQRLRESYQILPSDQVSIESSPHQNDAFRDVVQQIREELATFQPSRSATTSPAGTPRSKQIPAYLPYLCNRGDQEELFEMLGEEYEAFTLRPIVYLLAGPDRECHEAFHERVARDLLPRLVGIPGVNKVDPIPLEWPLKVGNLALRVKNKLGSASSKPPDVAASLPEGLTYLVTTADGDQWDKKQEDTLRAYLDYWSSWPDLPGNRALCAGISISWRSKGPSDEDLATLFPIDRYPNIRFRILPDLTAIKQQHAEDWLSHRLVKQLYDFENQRDALRAKVKKTFENRPEIPMAEIAEPLTQILLSAL